MGRDAFTPGPSVCVRCLEGSESKRCIRIQTPPQMQPYDNHLPTYFLRCRATTGRQERKQLGKLRQNFCSITETRISRVPTTGRNVRSERPTSMMACFPISNVLSAIFLSLYRHGRLTSPDNHAESLHLMFFMLCAMDGLSSSRGISERVGLSVRADRQIVLMV